MAFGRADLCLDVRDLARSAAFYRALGFRKVEGRPSEGWLVLEREALRVGLYEGHIDNNLVNFRGGDLREIVRLLRSRRLSPTKVRVDPSDGSGRAWLKDPDGNVLFFDSTPRERCAFERKARRRQR